MFNIYNKFKSKDIRLIKSFIIKIIKKKIPNFDGNLSNLHKFVDKNNLNKLRYSCFNEINKNFNWEDSIFRLCQKEINSELGKDLLIQSKINISIQMPMDELSQLPAHSDCWSADSPFQKNIWIPLTNAFKTNSMFILNKKKTLRHLKLLNDYNKHYVPKKINNNDFINIKFGQILIFNPAILHGNVINKTSKTRVSLNIRVKSIFSPEPTTRNPDRKFGTYYKLWKVSEDTLLAKEYFNNNFL